MSWLGLQEAHHQLSHDQAIDKLIQINQFYAAEVAKLIADLKAVLEGDGTMFETPHPQRLVVVRCLVGDSEVEARRRQYTCNFPLTTQLTSLEDARSA